MQFIVLFVPIIYISTVFNGLKMKGNKGTETGTSIKFSGRREANCCISLSPNAENGGEVTYRNNSYVYHKPSFSCCTFQFNSTCQLIAAGTSNCSQFYHIYLVGLWIEQVPAKAA